MGRKIGLGRIWSLKNFVLGFRSLVARLAPFKRESEQRGRIFWQRKVWTANFSATMVRQEVWREKRKVRFFGKGKCELTAIVRIFGMGKCKLIANFSATMMTSLPSISLSLSLSLYLSLSPSVPHAQYRKRFRASYNYHTNPMGSLPLYACLSLSCDTRWKWHYVLTFQQELSWERTVQSPWKPLALESSHFLSMSRNNCKKYSTFNHYPPSGQLFLTISEENDFVSESHHSAWKSCKHLLICFQ